MNVRPTKIIGRWKEGYALDQHTVSSTYVGDDEYGHPKYETTRTELGELLYLLKYRADASVVAAIVDALAGFVAGWKPGADLVIPVPPTRQRVVQPVLILAQAVAARLGLQFATESVRKARDVPELKDVQGFEQRVQLLEGAHTVDRASVAGRRVLLFDDLYRSGATMNAIASALYDEGGASEVFALTVTRTRSNQ